MKINIDDRKYIRTELEQCQSRVLQTLVPTILALGLIAVTDPANIGVLSLGCAFAVLFSSSLYVACLSYKIFRNYTFLSVFRSEDTDPEETDLIDWNSALRAFNRLEHSPHILKAETTTASVIYLVLALTFFYVFITVNYIATIVATAILLLVSIRIYFIYRSIPRYRSAWEKVKVEAQAPRGSAV